MNKPKMLWLVAVAALAVAPFAGASDEVQTVEMSTDAYNRLVFPEPTVPTNPKHYVLMFPGRSVTHPAPITNRP